MKCAFLLEDHSAFRQALAYRLNQEPDIEVIGEAGTLEEGRRSVWRILDEINIAVFDLLLPDGVGADLFRELRDARSDLPILVLTVLREQEIHDWTLAMGATETLTKDATLEEIIDAIRRLANNGQDADQRRPADA